jgi:hypothetical protein
MLNSHILHSGHFLRILSEMKENKHKILKNSIEDCNLLCAITRFLLTFVTFQ